MFGSLRAHHRFNNLRQIGKKRRAGYVLVYQEHLIGGEDAAVTMRRAYERVSELATFRRASFRLAAYAIAIERIAAALRAESSEGRIVLGR